MEPRIINNDINISTDRHQVFRESEKQNPTENTPTPANKQETKENKNTSKNTPDTSKTTKKPKTGIGCLTFSGVLVFFILLAIVFITPTLQNNTTGALGGQFAPMIDASLRLFFLFMGFVGVVTTFLGFFIRAGAKKDSPDAGKSIKKYGINLLISGIILIFGAILTGIFYTSTLADLFSAQRSQLQIITTPVSLSGSAPFETTFNIPEIGQARFFKWDFGDGGTANGRLVKHTFTSVGEFAVKIDITLLDGRVLHGERIVSINNLRPIAKATASPISGPSPLRVNLDASESTDENGEIVKHEWIVGEGKLIEGEKTTYIFKQTGSHEITLRVTDNNGDSTETTLNITVEDPGAPIADFTADPASDKSNAPAEIKFDASGSSDTNGRITKYAWDFGDSSAISYGKTITHTFQKAGTFIVRLETTDDDGFTGIKTAKYIVKKSFSKPQAKFQSPLIPPRAPTRLTFDGGDSTDDGKVVSYIWSIGGEIKHEGKIFSYDFTKPDIYNVTLTVEDDMGLRDSKTNKIRILSQKAEPPVAKLEITPNPASITIGDFIEADASGSFDPDGSIISYQWDFGDGKTEVGPASLRHRYEKVGIFTVAVTVIDNKGKSTITESIIAVNNIRTEAKFASSNLKGKAPFSVDFDATPSKGSIVQYFWDFGDNSTQTGRTPTHIFNQPGTYTVLLRVTDASSQESEFTQEIIVE